MIKLLFSFLWLITASPDATTSVPQSFESMLCKEWKFRSIEEGGRRTYPNASDRFIFNANHTSEIRTDGETLEGLWQYDAATKRMMITDRVTKETMIMTVVSIVKDELIIKTIEDNEEMATIYLFPVK